MGRNLDTTILVNYDTKESSLESRGKVGRVEKQSLHTVSPVITIAIPTYKRPYLLKQAVLSALNQIFSHEYEILIIDNDDSREFFQANMETARLHDSIKYIVNNTNVGMFGNWNQTIINCETDLISILNDDDLLFPNFLNHVYSNRENNKLQIVSCLGFNNINELNFEDKNLKRFKKISKSDFFWRNPSNGSLGVVFNKNIIKSLEMFEESKFPISDYEFFYSYFLKYGAIKTKSVLVGYRWSDNESLKREVLEAFLIKGYFFRLSMINSSNVNAFVSKILQKISQIIFIKHYFGFVKINRSVSYHLAAKECDLQSIRLDEIKNIGRIKSAIAFVLAKLINS